MSLSPYLLADLLFGNNDVDYPLHRSRYSPRDRHAGYFDNEGMFLTPVVRIRYRDHPQQEKADQGHLVREGRGTSQVTNDPDKFQVLLDVQHFAPNEIEVKTVDNDVVIHAKHEERPDEHGFISREFCRRYVLPEGVEVDKVVSSLNSQGILCIEAPRKRPEKVKGNERVIPIKVQHLPAASVSDKSAESEHGDAEMETAK